MRALTSILRLAGVVVLACWALRGMMLGGTYFG
jgi:hypothetical protein